VRFGRPSNEMWCAVRLDVDMGMHDKYWTRRQAIDYFLAHVATTEYNTASEVDRYTLSPIKLASSRLRNSGGVQNKDLELELNAREFHDAVLLAGSLPLSVLQKQANAWIERKKIERQKLDTKRPHA
jgi:uncharacterized protein (DUF885 family)